LRNIHTISGVVRTHGDGFLLLRKSNSFISHLRLNFGLAVFGVVDYDLIVFVLSIHIFLSVTNIFGCDVDF